MKFFNLKTSAITLPAVVVTGSITYLIGEREADRLRANNQALNDMHAKLAAELMEAREVNQLRDGLITVLKRDVADLPRLRGDNDRLNRDLNRERQMLVVARNDFRLLR